MEAAGPFSIQEADRAPRRMRLLHSMRSFCSRQKIFLSYASEDFPVAEEIAQTLVIEGHEVFFDRRSLKASDNYGARIRNSINAADRFIFLISRNSLSPNSYTLTELEFAQSRWPSPVGSVIPVLMDDTVAIEQVPVYLRSVHILKPKGNAATEVAAAVHGLAKIKPRCWAILAAGVVAIAGMAGWAWSGLTGSPSADIVLQRIEKVYFSPLREPPPDTAAADAPTDWASSPVTVTLMQIAYNHRTEPSRRARVLSEQIDLNLGDRTTSYRWAYVVEVTTKSCPDWLCVKTNAGPETLEPGRASTPRETMFLPTGGEPVQWKDFFDYVLAAPAARIKVVLRYTLDLPSGSNSHEVIREKDCHIDVLAARAAFLGQGFKPDDRVRPPFMQTACLTSAPAPPS
jgi:hypothetical protein